MLKCHASGPTRADIMIVGEAPGFEEEMADKPFVGASGYELKKMLKEAGIDMEACYLTNVCKYRPPGNDMSEWLTTKKTSVKSKGFKDFFDRYAHPLVVEGYDELVQEVQAVRPKVIIGFGNTALLALTGKYGVTNWRGSEMLSLIEGIPFVPTIHPAAVLRNYSLRPIVVQDLRYRVKRRLDTGFVRPRYEFNVAPTFLQVGEFLESIEDCAAADIETADGHIVCVGIAKSEREAICIPMYNEHGVYWPQDDLKDILLQLRKLAEKKSVIWTGQNWNYDAQYFEADFGWTKMADFDTYIGQSVLWPGSERGLGYMSSVYCDHHSYWKEDGKDWSKGIKDFTKEFNYNCRDAIATWEVAQKQRKALAQHGLQAQFEERMRYSHYVYRMMMRGVNRCPVRTGKMINEVNEEMQAKELAVAAIAGKPVNIRSPKQVGELLYKQMGLKAVGKRTMAGAASTNDEALMKLIEKNPNAAEVCMPILEARSLGTIKSNFLEAECDPDGKFRSSWMATGTETFRLTSGGNAFHRGGPLQNVTDGKHTGSGRPLPNLRSTIVPDTGYTMFNCDLERADLQVVAWGSRRRRAEADVEGARGHSHDQCKGAVECQRGDRAATAYGEKVRSLD
jgi:uracil-DNA glycosylase